MPKQVRRKQQSKAREPSSESDCLSESEPSQLSVQQRGIKPARARKPSDARTVIKKRSAVAKKPAVNKRHEASDSDIGDQASDEDNDDDDGTDERVQRKSDTSSKARTGSSSGADGEGANYKVQLEKKIAMARQFLDSFANDRRAEVEALSKSSEMFVKTQSMCSSIHFSLPLFLTQTHSLTPQRNPSPRDETLTTVTTRVREFQKTAESKRVKFLDMYAQIEDERYKIQSENAIQEMQAHAASVFKESQSLIKKDLGSGSKIKSAMEALLCVKELKDQVEALHQIHRKQAANERDLQEAEEQFSTPLQSHCINTDTLVDLHLGLQTQFRNELGLLEAEFHTERALEKTEILRIIARMELEFQETEADAKDEYSSQKDDSKHKATFENRSHSFCQSIEELNAAQMDPDLEGVLPKEFPAMEQFNKRFNKICLDVLAVEKQNKGLTGGNSNLRSILRQYLDGIGLNEDALNQLNPLVVVNISSPTPGRTNMTLNGWCAAKYYLC
ncbi:hypothetical protein CcCBS67573_g04764 [Chytriomyces confervae]|uniref:Uncharacterized protein n=1 Tax=Chytriomyces confervae TaxID=246404 RepID=A0A507FCF2_9FUNG|nr:hypothetical protein CcCBS67573_g04764 [Chytriomyces confervae]